MTDTITAGIGHNGCPVETVDPMEAAIAAFDADREEAETWLDGRKVDSQGQLDSVETLSANMREARSVLEAAKEGEYRPHKNKCDDVIAKYKPTLSDYDTIIKGLVGLVGPFKKKLADEAAEKTRLAFEETRRLELEAERKTAAADVSDIDAQREAQAAKQEAMAARTGAREVAKEKPKRMRQVTRYEIESHKDALHWIAKNDKDAMTAFIEDYVRRNHKAATIDGVKVWHDVEAY